MVITKYASKDQRKDLGIDINFEVNQYIYIKAVLLKHVLHGPVLSCQLCITGP